ncbi:MAG: exodeoxyribonuclease VII large subunit [Acidimicrobiia bacterium]|nr:exodeoxyribonuclease VII large subunit [Acidimicrobiia bacterium]
MNGSLFDEEVGGPPTLTVGELAARIARLTASAFPGDLWVEGQIRNLSRSANGHAYFNLAEPSAAGETPRAQVSVTLLAPERKHVNDQLMRAGGAVRMDDGIEVRIQGRLRWYAPRGTLQLRMHGIDPAFTIGRLQADRDRILASLAADGLLDANRTRPMPLVPMRLGLVTSRASAAHADVLAELASSGIGFTVREIDARTQGGDCGPSVARALRRLAADGVDLVLLVRGGGARTDLAGFDTDVMARAIASMPVPVLTGIGHEVDRSIADEVAHASHKTPTAAAASVVEVVRSFLDRLDDQWSMLRRAAASSAAAADTRLDRRAARVGRAATRTLARQVIQLDSAATRTARGADRALLQADALLGAQLTASVTRADRGLGRAHRSLDAVAARIRAHDPQLALARGWTITTTSDGNPVRGLDHLTTGTGLRTRFADGTAFSTVDRVEPAPREPTSLDPGPSTTTEETAP